MTGWLSVKRMVKAQSWFVLFILFQAPGWAEDVEIPSLEFLEFLAEGTELDGEWIDPVRFNEMTQQNRSDLGEEPGNDE